MADKEYWVFPDGTTLVYYQQNVNKCTDLNVGFRIPQLDVPRSDEMIGFYKNIVFYATADGIMRIPINKPGVAHFVEHMMFSSLPNISKEEIFSFFRKTNTLYNAETSQDYVKMELNFPSKFAEAIFALSSQMIFRNQYNKQDLNSEKSTIYQELERSLDNDNDSPIKMLFPINDLLSGAEILGIDKRMIDSFSERQLIKFGKTYFTKQNMIITCVSDLPFEQIKEMCEKFYVDKAPSIKETIIETPKTIFNFNSDLQYLTTPNPTQGTATIEFILKGSPDLEQNDLFSNIEEFILNDLGGRLFEKFRSKNGMTYTPIFDTIHIPHQTFKIFQIQTTPEHVSTCIDYLAEILHDLITEGITDDEFQGFKEMWENRRERKSNLKVNSADRLFTKVLHGEECFIGQFFEKTRRLSVDMINTYLWNIYAKSNLCVCVSGNYDKKEILTVQEILAKYRPYDKYLSEHYIEHDKKKKLIDYIKYANEHPDEEVQIDFIFPDSYEEEEEEENEEETQEDEDVENDNGEQIDSVLNDDEAEEFEQLQFTL